MAKKTTGRPSLYSAALARRICSELAHGKSLVRICQQPGMPGYQTVLDWLNRDEEPYATFSGMYAQAREHQADYLADEIVDISDQAPAVIQGNDKSDGARVQAIKLQVEARKWTAAKLRPRKYGDRIANEVSGPEGGPIVVVDAGQNPYQGEAKTLLPPAAAVSDDADAD